MYFNGFCLINEDELFNEFIVKNDYSVSGFSYGAINALEYTLNMIKNNKRVDLLQLFSPSYFCTQSTKYKRMQLIHFNIDTQTYINNFINNASYPSKLEMNKYLCKGTYTQLETLLYYEWNKEDLELLVKNNVKIEVYLGQKDKIIDTKKSKDFFINFAEIYFFNNCGHMLK